jgi:hypothetical protein
VRRLNRGQGSGNCFLEGGPDTARPSGAAGLIEVELGDGLRGARVKGRRLVEVVGGERIHRRDGIGVELECGLGRPPGGESRGAVWGSSKWRRLALMGPGSVRNRSEAAVAEGKKETRMSDPQAPHRRGKTSQMRARRRAQRERAATPVRDAAESS